jgi:hypothetical protein
MLNEVRLNIVINKTEKAFQRLCRPIDLKYKSGIIAMELYVT